jgi:hypothetical protein
MQLDNQTKNFAVEKYRKSMAERGFSKGSLRTFKPFQSTGFAFTNRIIIGVVISGKLEVQTALSVNQFEKDDEFLLPANLHFQVSAGVDGAAIFFARQIYSSPHLEMSTK